MASASRWDQVFAQRRAATSTSMPAIQAGRAQLRFEDGLLAKVAVVVPGPVATQVKSIGPRATNLQGGGPPGNRSLNP